MINIGLSLTNRIAGGAMYKAVASFTQSMFASINSRDGLLTDVTLHGLSTQAGTPTPDVPVPIVSTTGGVTVKSDSKNMSVSNRTAGSAVLTAGITYTVNADGSMTANGTSTGDATFYPEASGARTIRVLAGVTYTIQSVAGGSAGTYYTELAVLNDDATNSYYTSTGASLTFTPTKSGMGRVVINIRNGVVVNNMLFKPQLEVGSVATAFEKNTTSTKTLPLGSTQLRSLPNGVSDRIYKDGSTWKLEQNVGTVVLNGTETWLAHGVTTTDGSFTYKTSSVNYNAYSGTAALSDRFIYNSSYTWTNGYINLNNNASDVLFLCSTQTTVANFKTWLGTNNTTVHYNLGTSVTTQITDPTLITALENIRTYQGVTNITASTPISGQYYSL